MRWTRANGALILLTASLTISTLLLPKRPERVDREGVPLPPSALARLGSNRDLPIYSAQFTRHGRSLILHGTDGSIRIRDWATGYERRCWRSARIGKSG